MSNYTPTFPWSSFDSLPSGNPNKIVKASSINVELNNIQTAVNSKSNAASPTFSGTTTIADLTVTGTMAVNIIDGGTF